jgi:DNA-directed RNA polymerase subunit RPC12/RpoP
MPITQKVLTTAAAVGKAVGKGGLLVHASTDRSLLKSANASKELAAMQFSEFACSDCKTTLLATSVNPEPFCVVCGSHHVKATNKKDVKASVPQDDKLIAVNCGHCKAANVLPSVITATTKGLVHCASCGTGIQAMVEGGGEPSSSAGAISSSRSEA